VLGAIIYIMEQKELDEYWDTLKTTVKPLEEGDQRKISYTFCLMVEKELDDIGKRALQLVEKLTLNQGTLQKSKLLQKKLQDKLPKDEASVYSPLIWALEPHTNSYPVWYSAGIAGLNLVDLKVATLPELTKLTKAVVSKLNPDACNTGLPK